MDKSAIISLFERLPAPPLSEKVPNYTAFKLTWEHAPLLVELVLDEQYYQTDIEAPSTWIPVHAWRALRAMSMPCCIEALLAGFNSLHNNAWAQCELPQVIASAGQRALSPTAEFMHNEANDLAARNMAVETLQLIATRWPEQALWVTEQLSQFIDMQIEEDPLPNLGYSDNPLPSQAPVPKDINNDELFDRLQAHLDYYGNDKSIQNVSGLDGFFSALACAPEPVSPELWLPVIWGGEEYMPEFASTAQLSIFIELVMKLHNQNYLHVQETEAFLATFMLDENTDEGFATPEGNILVEDWCDGFLRGAVVGSPAIIDIDGVPDLLTPIVLFGTEEGYRKLQQMSSEEVGSWQQTIEPQVLKIRDWVREKTKITTITRTEPKVGRNDPCFCGSGKKFKKCCMRT